MAPSPATAPGSARSTLGDAPGSGAVPFNASPGVGSDVLGGRIGTAFPRAPASIATPGGGAIMPPASQGIAAPPRLPIAVLPLYGPLEVPDAAEPEGPANGLTLDQAIDRVVRENLDLRSRFFEVPQARADILTASLRSNPILYADTQLVPYGRFTRATGGGPTQADLNITHPFDVSGKRRARTIVAERAMAVLEAQYQDAVRLEIDNLGVAYVDVLAARETVRFARASVVGLGRVVEASRRLFERSTTVRPDVDRARILLQAARAGLWQAEEAERRARRTLAVLLNLPVEAAETLQLRATIAGHDVPVPPRESLIASALEDRPDIAAYRIGVRRAQADVRLARANRLADIHVLFQPYTFQNNQPFGLKSPTSWAVGATVPVPIHDRNQGTIGRARLNVEQTALEQSALERKVVEEVIQAERSLALSGSKLRQIERELLPAARRMRDDHFLLYRSGEEDFLAYLEAQRGYNEVVRRYRDALVGRRRAQLGLNTAVGRRLMP